jgi:hypothetical protein
MEEALVEKTLTGPSTPTESAEYQAAVDQIIAEIERTTERMKKIQEQTERLGAETRAMLEQLKAI